ncbi:unnamed protein product, partial [Staurois parvus]
MPLVPFSYIFFEFGQGHRGPIARGPHELSIRPCPPLTIASSTSFPDHHHISPSDT